MTAPHALLVSEELPFRRVAGHHQINMALIDFLRAKGYRVTLLLTAPRLPAPIVINPYPDIAVCGPGTMSLGSLVAATQPRSFLKLLAKKLVEAAPPLIQSLVRGLRSKVASTQDGILGKFDSKPQIDWVVRWIALNKPDAVFFDTVFRCPIIPQLKAPRPKIFVITHDVFHLRHASLRKRGLSLFPETFTREQEIALLSPAEILIAINAEEQTVLQDMIPAAQVIEANMPVAVIKRPAGQPRDLKRILFVGSNAVHNADGLRWFLSEVWPLIRKADPAAHLDVYGLVCGAVPFAPEGVSLLGRQRSLTPAYHSAGLALCPLLAGSGLKIKMLEYFSHGLACVTTPTGASGFAPSAAPPFVVAEEAAGFANAVLRFLKDPALAESFEQRAYDYCGLYSVELNFAALSAALSEAAAQL
jgi:glycosyltransferase involved in cell wall biosynthesis